MHDWRHAITNKLCAADATLNASEDNKSVLTAMSSGVDVDWYVNWIIVAFTPEKKAAIVVMVK